MKIRYVVGLGAYALLALIALFTLDGVMRAALLVLFAGLAIKTLIHSRDED